MKEEIERISKLVAEGKLSPKDAADLIEAFVASESAGAPPAPEASVEEEPRTEEVGDKAKDPLKSIIDSFEKLIKDGKDSVNWQEVGTHAKQAAKERERDLPDFTAANVIDIKELTMTLFTGDATDRVETMILSPVARVLADQSVVTGPDRIRVINDNFEATGLQWRYDHKEKSISIAKNVRVTFRAELKDFLK